MRISKNALGLAAAFLLSSCASFQQVGISPVEGWPPTEPGTKSVNITMNYEYLLNGSAMEGMARAQDSQAERAATIYVDSGLFSQVGRGRGPADLHATISLRQEEKGSLLLAFLTGLTLYVIPSKADITYDMSTTFSDEEGNELGTIHKTETVRLWQQLLMAFVMPFKYPITVNLRTMNDLHRATLLEASTNGII